MAVGAPPDTAPQATREAAARIAVKAETRPGIDPRVQSRIDAWKKRDEERGGIATLEDMRSTRVESNVNVGDVDQAFDRNFRHTDTATVDKDGTVGPVDRKYSNPNAKELQNQMRENTALINKFLSGEKLSQEEKLIAAKSIYAELNYSYPGIIDALSDGVTYIDPATGKPLPPETVVQNILDNPELAKRMGPKLQELINTRLDFSVDPKKEKAAKDTAEALDKATQERTAKEKEVAEKEAEKERDFDIRPDKDTGERVQNKGEELARLTEKIPELESNKKTLLGKQNEIDVKIAELEGLQKVRNDNKATLNDEQQQQLLQARLEKTKIKGELDIINTDIVRQQQLQKEKDDLTKAIEDGHKEVTELTRREHEAAANKAIADADVQLDGQDFDRREKEYADAYVKIWGEAALPLIEADFNLALQEMSNSFTLDAEAAKDADKQKFADVFTDGWEKKGKDGKSIKGTNDKDKGNKYYQTLINEGDEEVIRQMLKSEGGMTKDQIDRLMADKEFINSQKENVVISIISHKILSGKISGNEGKYIINKWPGIVDKALENNQKAKEEYEKLRATGKLRTGGDIFKLILLLLAGGGALALTGGFAAAPIIGASGLATGVAGGVGGLGGTFAASGTGRSLISEKLP